MFFTLCYTWVVISFPSGFYKPIFLIKMILLTTFRDQ